MCRWLLDTNVILSGLFWSGNESWLLALAQEGQFQAVLCEFVIKETRRIISEKFPESSERAQVALEILFAKAERYPLVSTKQIRRFKKEFGDVIPDQKDLAILAAAKESHVDAIISGDKHFHRPDVKSIVTVMTAAQALKELPCSS